MTKLNQPKDTGDLVFWTREAQLYYDYFRTLQQHTGQIVPPRKAFMPAAARAFLPYVSIIEVSGPESMVVRLVGTAMANRTGFGGTGHNILDSFPENVRSTIRDGFLQLLRIPCGATYIANEQYQNGPLPAEIVSFPFADASGVTNSIISVSVEIDRQMLLLKGENRMTMKAPVFDVRLIDIGVSISGVQPVTRETSRPA